ncbi:MAG: hypothetical protein J07HX64_00344 [halophilic archaeon J07HX64]|jgi:hypothetical protein|nr:MAG: hypothetical protein J07HX64_00344 [halophilic archaeon J07HX64]
MVGTEKLGPGGTKTEHGERHSAYVNLHENELTVAGVDVGDEMFARVREDRIIVQRADTDELDHEF